jgi:pimeloyl-ACP methyl ester carboxylesterase
VNWTVRAFWFDWRKDLDVAADALNAQLSAWFPDDAPIHIVAHSMGGLVARTFIKKYPGRWKKMWQDNGRAGGRLIMLGTPNHGSFVIPQVITGLEGLVKKLALLDLRHSMHELLATLNSFVGSYQMLPSPLVMPAMAPLYQVETYGALTVSKDHLKNAFDHHRWLSDVVDPQRMIYIAGDNQPTLCNITDCQKLDSPDAYEATMRGDGRVSHRLGLLTKLDGQPAIPTYYIEENHGDLTINDDLLGALDDLLTTGHTASLARQPISSRDAQADAKAREQLRRRQEEEETLVRAFAARMHTRSAESPSYISTDERRVEEILLRGFLSDSDTHMQRQEQRKAWLSPPHIEIRLVHSAIEALDEHSSIDAPIDAIAVGHYFNVKPQAAELALDKAISGAIPYNGTGNGAPSLLLTDYTERGIIRGELGQPFFLPDPRQRTGNGAARPERLIAIAGMGMPGRFGTPELAVLARELCWSLGRIGKRHLITVLIGAGNGNLSAEEAIAAWLRGVTQALSGSSEEDAGQLHRITFVELNPLKLEAIQTAILKEQELLRQDGRLLINYVSLSPAQLDELWEKGLREQEQRVREQRRRPVSAQAKREPTRVTLSLEGKTYRFGAITATASIPEREIPLDPDLVMRANDELAAESEPTKQCERGQFLEKLLVPADLRTQFFTDAPLVMLLDATTARIHWEMVAQSEDLMSFGTHLLDDEGMRQRRDEAIFLGRSRGFTRQLRTTFAPPPEPPPPPRRLLRVLVVADPAEDAHLPGAEEEGVEVADLFEAFNTVYGQVNENRVEVIRLFGPREATRTNVLRHLMLRTFDVLHFAGHCVYDSQEPAASGWIFSNKERLTANEMNRIDRIPRFVFSNACESGITPDRAEKRSAELAPTFAEAFFARGVSNFVCTAWPVDDVAAREFALLLYTELLGLARPTEEGKSTRYVAAVRSDMDSPWQSMHEAMRTARRTIARMPNGVRTWGAYQHYGNPYYRLFGLSSFRQTREKDG